MRVAELRLSYLIVCSIVAALMISACGVLWGSTEAISLDRSSGKAAEQTYILSNAAVYTLNPAQPWAEAVAIEDGVIKAVGAEADAQQAVASKTPVIDLGGKMLMPGFQDAHLHANELSPFEKLQAVIRRDVEAISDRDAVLRMMTLDVAYLLHQEETTGSIEPGKFADLIVVDRNLLEAPTQELGKTQVLLTLLEGEPVYDPTGILD